MIKRLSISFFTKVKSNHPLYDEWVNVWVDEWKRMNESSIYLSIGELGACSSLCEVKTYLGIEMEEVEGFIYYGLFLALTIKSIF